jgi:putative redox protein
MEVTAYWEGGYRCRVPVRRFEIVSDEPHSVGGTDAGPTPTELLLSSLAVCFAMAVHHAARRRAVELPDLAVTVAGDYEGNCFSGIELEVASTHPRPELEELIERAKSYCYVSNTLSRAPELRVTIADVSGAPSPAPER